MHGAVTELSGLLREILHDRPWSQARPDIERHLASWAERHGRDLGHGASAVSTGIPEVGEMFEKAALADSAADDDHGRIRFSLHRWPPGHVLVNARPTPHNHVMSFASVILSGALTHFSFPSVSLSDIVPRLLLGEPAALGDAVRDTYRANDAYTMPAEEFHLARNDGAEECVTFFALFPAEYAGNFRILPESGTVQVRVGEPVAAHLTALRTQARDLGRAELTARCLQVLRDQAPVPADRLVVLGEPPSV
jgi:hypothetical protein